MKKCLIYLLLSGFAYGCATVPITGRKQLKLISNQEIIPLSFKSYQQVLAENKLSSNQEWSNMVKTVGVRIKGAVEKFMDENGLARQLDGFEWEFNLIELDVANAWAMPGGKVAFYTGIMPICKDENGVAVVMGHEVAHAIANHGRERMSTQLAAQLGISTLSVAVGQNPTLSQEILFQSVGIGTQLGMLKFSRTHESEADEIGLIFMAIAGYDPHEAPKFWERMQEMSNSESPAEWLSTHPSHERRISDLNKQVPEAMKYYRNE